MGHFTGTFVGQENQFNSPTGTVADSSPTPSQNSPAIAPLNDPQQGTIIPFFTTIVKTRTATVQGGPRPIQTILDGSRFGGPGGDLTNIKNNDAVGFSEISQSGGNVRRSNNIKGRMMAIMLIFFLFR